MRKRNPDLGLKLVIILLAVFGALVFFCAVPLIGMHYRRVVPTLSWLYWPVLCYTWIVAMLCYAGLWRFAGVVKQIRQDNSFCVENAGHMRAIARLAWACAAWVECGFIALYHYGMRNILILLLFQFGAIASGILGVLAGALAGLILRAAEIKRENDLTI